MDTLSKQRLRKEMKARRARLSQSERASAATGVVKHLPQAIDLAKSTSFGLYHPLQAEFETRPLAEFLWREGAELSLPVVVGECDPLLFRPWESDAHLDIGAFNIKEPRDNGLSVLPDVLFIPLLAFDENGARLGYGGGYYDRTLASFRAGKGVIAIGLGYEFQRAAPLPVEPHDQQLDIILTPAGFKKF